MSRRVTVALTVPDDEDRADVERMISDNTYTGADPSVVEDETYHGWSNRETWAVALYVNNDQGWQASVHETLRKFRASSGPWGPDGYTWTESEFTNAHIAGDIIRENVEERLDPDLWDALSCLTILSDIGSLWRVDWTELGASFLDDIKDES